MPLPFIAAAAGAVITTALGAAGHSAAKDDQKKAKRIIKDSKRKYRKAKDNLDDKKEKITEGLEEYGKFKLQVTNNVIGEYIKINKTFNEKLNGGLKTKIDHKKYSLSDNEFLSKKNYIKLDKSVISAKEIIGGGLASVSSGALLSVGAYNGIGILATASTGTAISSLSGVAASNATLAWLGGGSLASGGLGIAGGTAVLGGIALGPAILVSSLFAIKKSSDYLEKAYDYESEVDTKVAKIESVISRLKGIEMRIDESESVLNKFSESLKEELIDYKKIVEKQINFKKSSLFLRIIDKIKSKIFKDYNSKYEMKNFEKKKVLIVELLVKKIYEVLENPIIDENGDITDQITKKIGVNKFDDSIKILENDNLSS